MRSEHFLDQSYFLEEEAMNLWGVEGSDPWDLEIRFSFKNNPGNFRISPLKSGDALSLNELSHGLGERSRYFFCPYPWDNYSALQEAFDKSIDYSTNRTDISYLLFDGNEIIGYFFLRHLDEPSAHGEINLKVPELGIAIIDKYQGQGLGTLAINFLQAISNVLDQDGIELTTAMDNQMAFRTYVKTGFLYVGVIRNLLGEDVAEKTGESYRDEQHMIYVINESKREQIMDYLALKREEASKLS